MSFDYLKIALSKKGIKISLKELRTKYLVPTAQHLD